MRIGTFLMKDVCAKHFECLKAKSAGSQHVIMDFVCPTRQLREIVAANVNIFMNTIVEGRFEDTNKLFEFPADSEKVSYTIHADQEAERIATDLMTADSC